MRGSKWGSDAERFWAKVDRSAGADACWIWKASTRSGYGQFKVGGKRGRMDKAHRMAWRLENGEIPATSDSLHGTCVCHRCDNPLCVNPKHLFLGTQRTNIRDRTVKQRSGRRLSAGDVVRIREMLRRGDEQKQIAPKFGVTPGTIGCIARGETWRWVA